MKIAAQGSEVLRGGIITQESSFTMNASQHAFEILSSGLYTDSVKAIVRELCANAYDSHVANGNPTKPFLIHIPSDIEPWFSIRDYGTGMSVEDVTGLYSTYFESTKTSTNDFIGGFGLGSKTPFSYTDNFQVVSYIDGVAHTFAIFVENGFPKIAQIGQKDSTESTGFEVRIPSEQTSSFADAVEFYTAYYNTKPKIINYDTSNIYTSKDIRVLNESVLNVDGAWFLSNKLNN